MNKMWNNVSQKSIGWIDSDPHKCCKISDSSLTKAGHWWSKDCIVSWEESIWGNRSKCLCKSEHCILLVFKITRIMKEFVLIAKIIVTKTALTTPWIEPRLATITTDWLFVLDDKTENLLACCKVAGQDEVIISNMILRNHVVAERTCVSRCCRTTRANATQTNLKVNSKYRISYI